MNPENKQQDPWKKTDEDGAKDQKRDQRGQQQHGGEHHGQKPQPPKPGTGQHNMEEEKDPNKRRSA